MHQNPSKPALIGGERSTTLQLHGVLVRVFETGVLLIGESGIGKSESALDLVTRGHQLVADDVVEVSSSDGELLGQAPELTYELLEIRGLGVINVNRAFGESAVRPSSTIDLCIELHEDTDVERIGNVMSETQIAGVVIQKFVIPVSAGRSLATLIETAVRLYINRDAGAAAAELLIEKQESLLRSTRQT